MAEPAPVRSSMQAVSASEFHSNGISRIAAGLIGAFAREALAIAGSTS